VKVSDFKLVRIVAHSLLFSEVWGTEHVLQ